MDRVAIRESLLTKFRPKKQDLDMPYFVAPDGEDLSKSFRLIGLTGAEGIALRQQSTVGSVTDESKFVGLLIVECLRLRDEQDTPVFDKVDGQNLLAELDITIVNKLGEDVQRFLGLTPTPSVTPSANSAPTMNNSSTDVSPGTSATPQ